MFGVDPCAPKNGKGSLFDLGIIAKSVALVFRFLSVLLSCFTATAKGFSSLDSDWSLVSAVESLLGAGLDEIFVFSILGNSLDFK